MRYPTEALVFRGRFLKDDSDTQMIDRDYELVEWSAPCQCNPECRGWLMPWLRRLDGTEGFPMWLAWLRPLTKAAKEAVAFEDATQWSRA